MPESNGREWGIRPEGGDDEQNREVLDIQSRESQPSRVYSPQEIGGPDETAALSEADRATLLQQMKESAAADVKVDDGRAEAQAELAKTV